MWQSVRKLVMVGGLTLLVLAAVGGAITVRESMPDNAIMIVRGEIYYPGVSVITVKRLEGVPQNEVAAMRLSEARGLGLQADAVSLQQGHFAGVETSLLRIWLSHLGVSRPSRWERDGTWRW